jgi:hypothetical protein
MGECQPAEMSGTCPKRAEITSESMNVDRLVPHDSKLGKTMRLCERHDAVSCAFSATYEIYPLAVRLLLQDRR